MGIPVPERAARRFDEINSDLPLFVTFRVVVLIVCHRISPAPLHNIPSQHVQQAVQGTVLEEQVERLSTARPSKEKSLFSFSNASGTECAFNAISVLVLKLTKLGIPLQKTQENESNLRLMQEYIRLIRHDNRQALTTATKLDIVNQVFKCDGSDIAELLQRLFELLSQRDENDEPHDILKFYFGPTLVTNVVCEKCGPQQAELSNKLYQSKSRTDQQKILQESEDMLSLMTGWFLKASIFRRHA